MPDVICIGELLVDFVSQSTGSDLAHTVEFRRAPGGAPANVACGVVKLGRSAGFVGKVGRDPFGTMLRETLDRVGVETTHLVATGEADTTLVFVAVHRDGRKDMAFFRNPGADTLLAAGDLDGDWLREARALHFGGVALTHERSREASLEAARLARDAGLMVTFDPNYREALWPDPEVARERFAEGIRAADVVKVSDEEWRLVTGADDFDEGARRVLEMGPALLAVSRGEHGCSAYTGRGGDVRGVDASAFGVEAVETTGAGDGFMASLLVDLLAERDAGRALADLDEKRLRTICRRANATGALTSTRAGAIPGLPMREEVDRFLAEQP